MPALFRKRGGSHTGSRRGILATCALCSGLGYVRYTSPSEPPEINNAAGPNFTLNRNSMDGSSSSSSSGAGVGKGIIRPLISIAGKVAEEVEAGASMMNEP